MTTSVTAPQAAAAPDLRVGVVTGLLAMVCVGSSVAVSATLVSAPLLAAQAVRYAAACLLLCALARFSGRRLIWPRGVEWAWLAGVAAAGLALFNVALVRGAAHAEPAVFGVAVACVPLVLAVAGPAMARAVPSRHVLAAALVVTVGAVLVQRGGRADATGLAWALVVLACEVAFTVLAVPVLPRLGPWSLSVYATGLAAALLGALGMIREGPAAAGTLTARDLLAVGYLAIVVTALAFVLWYTTVARLGSARAGLLTGIAPAAAAAAGVLLGEPPPHPVVWCGMTVVVIGLVLGLRPRPPHPNV